MLKRLLFAVFVLGLVFTLSGTAISGIGQKPVEGLNPIPLTNPNAQLYNQTNDARPAGPTWRPPDIDAIEVQMPGMAPTPPSTYFCEYQYYYDDTATAVFVWGIPSASTRDIFSVKFTVEENFACTLKAGWALMYGGLMTGTPSVRMYLFADNGFDLPGAKLDSADIPYASLPLSFGYVGADWSSANWIFNENEEYHIGWRVLGGPTDKAYLVSDKATGPHVGENRNGVYILADAAWYTMFDFYGVDYGFFIEAERCCYELPFSDCYSQNWDEGTAYYWRAPHPAYNIIDYAQRFTVAGKETLASVDIAVYNMGATPPNVSGNGNLVIKVWDDNGAGLPGAVLATEIVPAGTYPFYPAYTSVDFYSHGLVFNSEDFFVSFNSDETFPTDCEATLSDNALTPHGRSYCYYGGGWLTIGTLFGIDVDLKYTANLCIDPYNVCNLKWYNLSPLYYWTLPDAYGDVANAQRIKAVGLDCKVYEVSWALYDYGDPDLYTHDSKISVYSDVGGLPGAELESIIVTPADYIFFPGYTKVDFEPLDVHVTGSYWVAIESFAPIEAEGIATLTDFGGGGWFDGAAELWGTSWGLLCNDWGGVPCDIAFDARSEHCCIPFPERFCEDIGPTEWTTHQQDQQRTGASGNAYGDAQCDLTVLWSYVHPVNSIWYTGPVISGDRIACVFDNQVLVFNLAAGGPPIYTISGFPLGNNIRCTPHIANGVMYLSGGDQQSISAWNFATGAMIWSRDIGTVGIGGLFGQVRWASFITLVQGTTTVLYWGTDAGKIVAADAATGALWGGWVPNPVTLPTPAAVQKSGSTDGVSLFYNTMPGGVPGDVYSIDAATGVINWQLSVTGPLQANVVFPEGPQLAEGFPGGNSNEDGVLYVNSDIATPYHPGDGVFYAINTVDGSIKYAVGSVGARLSTASGTPVIDQARVYTIGESGWVNTVHGGRVVAFQKNNGAFVWAYDSPEYNNYWGDAALSCEPEGAPDLLFVAGHHGFINVLNSDNGDEIYRRRIDWGAYPNSVGLSFAMAPDYVAMSDYYGTLYVMAKGDDRSRLELQSYQVQVPVEFGTATSLPTTIKAPDGSPLLVNTGCADLVFGQATTNLNPNHTWFPLFTARQVREDVMHRAAGITDLLTEDFTAKALVVNAEPDIDEYFVTRDRGERIMSAGANAGVPFLQYGNTPEAVFSPLLNATLPGIDTMDVIIDVNQSMILRGPQDFYMTFPTNDPDFFLNGQQFGPPEIHVTIVGGCLTDTTYLYFGMGAANIHNVTNTGRIATGDDWMEPWGMDIDGDDQTIFQGAFIWANGVHEQAINTQAWHGQGEDYSYWSHQADPNWCDDLCHAHLDEDVDLYCLGGYSEDGRNYEPITGNRVCKTYLDSMQNFDLGGGWDWENFGAPFDNALTMGLMCESRTVGAVDFAPFKDLTIEIMEITERNGDPVTGWKMGATMDYDVGNDVAAWDPAGSAAWVSSGGTGDIAWGMMKFPFGCGTNPNVDFDPIINAVTMYGYAAWWGDIYMGDTAWKYLNAAPGVYTQNPAAGGDQEAHITIASHNWDGGDTYELAVAQFGLHGITGGSSAEIVALGKLANKWVGGGRGDVNNDGIVGDLADIMYLFAYVAEGGPGPIPFMHLGDVDCDGDVDIDDVMYLVAWYWNDGPCPCFDWCF